MRKYNDEYYYMVGNSSESIPLFKINESKMKEMDKASFVELSAIAQERPANNSLVIWFKLNIFYDDYKLTDYHVAPNPVFSTRVKELVEELEIPKTQFIPGNLDVGNGSVSKDYYLWHVYSHIKCMDKEDTEAMWFDDGDFMIRALSLSSELLDEIPLKERLVFRVDESTSKYLMHQTIVEKLKEYNIEGLEFISVSDSLAEFRGELDEDF